MQKSVINSNEVGLSPGTEQNTLSIVWAGAGSSGKSKSCNTRDGLFKASLF